MRSSEDTIEIVNLNTPTVSVQVKMIIIGLVLQNHLNTPTVSVQVSYDATYIIFIANLNTPTVSVQVIFFLFLFFGFWI